METGIVYEFRGNGEHGVRESDERRLSRSELSVTDVIHDMVIPREEIRFVDDREQEVEAREVRIDLSHPTSMIKISKRSAQKHIKQTYQLVGQISGRELDFLRTG